MKHFDLLVAGGGLAGVAAAVAAAREGCTVALVERSGALGGAMGNSFVYPFMQYATKYPDGTDHFLSAGLFAEMCRRHEALGCPEGELSPELFKIVLDAMCVEAGVTIFFHTQLVGVEMEGRVLQAVRVAGKEGIFSIGARFFVDATGDGDLFTFAGCDHVLGREKDNLCQPMTTCFRVSGVDVDRFWLERPRLQKLYREKREQGQLRNPRENILVFGGLGKGVLHFNTTRVVRHNPVDTLELSRAELEGRAQVLEMYLFLREHAESFAESALISVAQEIGVRESRKLRGVHVLTADELIAQTDFDDSIAAGCYCIDIHNPEGTGTYIHEFPLGAYYRIPYRSLLPKETDNLLVAGRCLSATHEAHSAVRIMPICACLGEAAGRAGALALQTDTNAHTLDVHVLQARLEANGAVIR